MRFAAITCLFFCFSLTVSTQPISLKVYSGKDGLSNNIVRNIAQDKFGHIWIGTENGLNKYDGHTFTSYLHRPSDSTTISNNMIFGLSADTLGCIWVGTDFGLNVYNPSINTFSSFQKSEKSSSLSNNHVRAVFCDKANNIWVGTEDGLNLFNRSDSTFTRYQDNRTFSDKFGKAGLSYNRINSITQAHDGKIWVGSDGGGVKIYSNTKDSFTSLSLPDGDEDHLFRIIRTIYQDSDYNMWFGCDGGLVKLDVNNQFKVFNPHTHPDSLGYRYIWSLLEDEENRLWAGSYGGGLFVFDKEEEIFTSHRLIANRTDGYDDNLLWPMFRDRDSNIWIGFDGNGGLGFYHPKSSKFIHLLASNVGEAENSISSILEVSNHKLIVNTSNERFLLVNERDKEALPRFFLESSFGDISLKLKEGYLFTRNGGFTITDFDFNISYQIEEDSIGRITCGVQDTEGIVWLGTLENGLIRFDPRLKKMRKFFTEGHLNIYHDSRSISALYLESDSILWVGAVRFGLVRFNTINQTKEQFLYQDNGFNEPTINTIVTDQSGSLWLGTDQNGLIKFDGVAREAEAFLLEDQIQGVIINKGFIWVSTTNGLVQLDPTSGAIIRFGTDDGIQDLIFNEAAHAGLSGNLYFGGVNGITKFRPEDIELNQSTSQVIIERIKIKDKALDWSMDEPIYEISQLNLPHDQNDLSIEFSANNFLHTDAMRYEYLLEGGGWRSLGEVRQLNLSNLSTGSYLLKIRSINHDGARSASRLLAITINPPWYNTIWFRLMFTALIALGLVLFYRYRLRSIREQKIQLEEEVRSRTLELEQSKLQVENDKSIIEQSLKERESLLKEIHHRVKNNLQIIASLLYLQSGKFEDENFKRVLEEGQGRVRSMALIHQKLYENDDLKSIPFGEYLQELTSEIRASFGMANIQLNIAADNIFFDVDTAVPLGLIVNEMATNAFKYAFGAEEQGSLSIFLTEENGTYTLSVKDDGKGISDEIDIRKTKSLGLRLVRMLSQQLEGDFKFESDNGTSFELEFAA